MSVHIEIEDRILRIRYNRPEKKHALTSAMYEAMAHALRDAEGNPAVRAIWFQGNPEIFTAGNDLEDFMRTPLTTSDAPVFHFLSALSQCGKPMVASVHGAAVGIGTTLLLHCELVYAADTARFCTPFTGLGLCPENASSLLLPNIAGYQRAAEKLLLGEWFDAFEAQQMGFVNKVLPAEEVDAHTRQQLDKLTALPPAALRTTKRLLKGPQTQAVQQQLEEENSAFRQLLTAPEAQEALTAFFEKRKPDFSKFQ
ncbi:MAG: enoyl-CoA hydratase [Burkholderiaceae bacterium]|nr:MAG: enoyl-CoA hydratase [Burkholderiaceae bacterium]